MTDKKIVTKIKRRTIVTRVEIESQGPFKKIEIRLPSNVVRITGVLVTAGLKDLPVP